jgi:pyruvate,water dikinase
MTWIKHFAEIGGSDLPLVGGKGLNLGKLTAAGFLVPPGFCVTTDAYRTTVGTVDTQNSEAFQAAALPESLQSEILTAYNQLGADSVAVRSSATAEDLPDASFAGQQDTFLNVSGPSELLEKIKACWASLWSDRAVAYRREHGIGEAQLAMAVVVQTMVDAEVSGVMFTRNPTGGDELVIESNWGLGESVVSGEITPDHFVISRETGNLIRETVVSKRKMIAREGVQPVPIGQREIPSLQRGQVAELGKLGMQVDAFYGAPQDVEWAHAEGQLYLLQARPITTLTDAAEIEQLRRQEIETLQKKADEGGTVWSRYNLSEVLPAPLPMTWAIMQEFMSGRGGFGLTCRELGFLPSRRFDEEGVVDLICGRLYFNLSREVEFNFHGFLFEHDFQQLKRDPHKAIYPQPTPNIKRSNVLFWSRFPYYIVKAITAEFKHSKIRKNLDRSLSEKIFPTFEQYVQTQREVSLEELSDQQVIDKFHEWREKTLNEFAKDALKATVFASFSYQQLEITLQKCFSEEEARDLARLLITGLEGDLTVDANLKMWEVAQGELTLEDFLEKHGHRSVGEFELAQPRWREDPSYVEQIIASFHTNPDANPTKHLQAQRTNREKAKRRLARLPVGKAAAFRKQINKVLNLTQRYMPFRETAKFYLMLGYELIRKALLELDRRYQLDGGIFYLVPDELDRLIEGEDLQSVIEKRKTTRSRLLKIELPDVIYSDILNRVGEPQAIEAKDEIQGVGVSVGVATGEAYVLRDAADAQIAGKNYILVCPSTDPGWTPLFLHAAALVMEYGGMLSHGAIVAREYGIPAVVNIAAATQRIQSGQRLRVDGGRGIVSILDDESA